ncbi:MAG TPA: GNAT family N-acetyltransferase [Bryobacteraceae bacterium]|jgi:ribosomal protein S18 acetylase RimI-like enzyme
MNITRFDGASGEGLEQVLACDPVVPYRAHRCRIGARIYDRWAAERGARLLSSATGAFASATGAIAWRKLDWDSELFGFPAARIDLLAVRGGYSEARSTACVLIEKAVEDAIGSAQIRHLSARVDASSLGLAHALTDCGFELIDGIQTFALPLGERSQGEPAAHTRLAKETDAEAIAAIARSSFVYDRFHNDLAIGVETADRVHEAWARNSVSGQAADAVLVCCANDPESIDSFVTLKIDSENAAALGMRIATIPLVATAVEARGQGAARRATEAALDWCRNERVDIVEVGTQISNIPAARLYQAAGFRTTAISLTYRKLIE